MRKAVNTPVERLLNQAREFYAEQKMAEACEAINAAAAKAPDHNIIAFMQAQFAYEGWFDSVALFERAASLDSGNADLIRNFAMAMASEGQQDRAERLLEGILARNPGWIEGQNVLATLRSTAGDEDPLRGFEQAAKRNPTSITILQAWFHKLAAARNWEAADRVIGLAEQAAPGSMRLAKLYLDCEVGDASSDPSIFEDVAGSGDPGIALMMVRHSLKHGDTHRALELALAQCDTPQASQFWPYVEICWRLLDDPKAPWLAGEPPFAAQVDLALSKERLGELAEFLRSLHQMKAPYPEQSVHGGTQTDRNLLLHHDPRIQQLRRAISDAVLHWRDGLPDDEGSHPFLADKPEHIRFSGSWSVRLGEGGHHSAHTHPQGWLSSALYVVVPDGMGAGHAGELAIGMAPPELDLDLTPQRHFEPHPGRLVLFPSMTWHGTVPFEGSERMTIAFDVAPKNTGACN